MRCQPYAGPCWEVAAGVGDNGSTGLPVHTPPSLAPLPDGEGSSKPIRTGDLADVQKNTRFLLRAAAVNIDGQI